MMPITSVRKDAQTDMLEESEVSIHANGLRDIYSQSSFNKSVDCGHPTPKGGAIYQSDLLSPKAFKTVYVGKSKLKQIH